MLDACSISPGQVLQQMRSIWNTTSKNLVGVSDISTRPRLTEGNLHASRTGSEVLYDLRGDSL